MRHRNSAGLNYYEAISVSKRDPNAVFVICADRPENDRVASLNLFERKKPRRKKRVVEEDRKNAPLRREVAAEARAAERAAEEARSPKIKVQNRVRELKKG